MVITFLKISINYELLGSTAVLFAVSTWVQALSIASITWRFNINRVYKGYSKVLLMQNVRFLAYPSFFAE